MSYILDALRRADSERERGAVPSIHSSPVPPLADDPKPQRGSSQSQMLVGVIVVLLLALAGLLAWHLMSGKQSPAVVGAEPAPAPVPIAEPSPEPPPVQIAPAPTPMPATPVPQAPAPVAQVAPIQPVAPAPVPAPPIQRPSPPPAQIPMAAAPILSVPPRPGFAAPPTRTAPSSLPTPTAEADNRIYTPSELPANIQRDLPKLVIGGAMYSETPANRMLIINSQVFHEGDKLTADLVLQEIRLKSAVLKYKGYRYGVSY